MTTSSNETPSSNERVSTANGEALGPRLARGAIGGVVAGAVFILVNMWFAASQGGPATMPLRLISTLVLGQAALQAGTTSVVLGVLVHAILSAGFGVVFALVVPALKSNGTVALAGGVYGALVYVVNFLVLANVVFPQCRAPNDPLEFAVHVVFGYLLAVFFYSSGVRRAEPWVAV